MEVYPAIYTNSFNMIAATIFVFMCILQRCSSYPSGAPLVACQEMRPYHPATTTSGIPPYAINLTETVYKPGSEIKGTVYSPKGVVFRGFLIQARLADNTNTTPYGEFIVSGTETHTNCGDANKQGLTHTTNSNKTEVDFTWKAPMTYQGDLHFKLTIVESYNVSRFWLDIYSAVVKDCSLHPSNECGEITTEQPVTSSQEPVTTSNETTPANTSPVTTNTSPAKLTTPPMAPTTSPSSSNYIPNDPECGQSKGCFPDCSKGCQYLVTWQVASDDDRNTADAAADDDGVNFDLKMILDDTENVWIAIGISPTGKMDETNVIACLTEGNTVSVESSHNEGYSNVMYSSKTLGLSNMKGSVQGKEIRCSFKRKLSMNVTDFMNLKDEAYLLFGTGPVSNGIKQQHLKIPVRSSAKVNFLANKVSTESDSATTLIKLHGSLMVVAWVLCSSIGVVIARHFKSMAPNKMMCSVHYWFAVHRTLMFTVVLCVMVAFVAIFYEIGGFSKISAESGNEYTEAHPYLGILVTILTLLNPIMAFFRPPTDHRSRPLFNWAHFSVGTVAHILSVVTIFFGIKLSKAKVDEYATDVMIAYSVIFVVVQLLLELQRRRSDNKDLFDTNLHQLDDYKEPDSITYGKLNSNSMKQRLLTKSNSLTSYKSTTIDVKTDDDKEGVSGLSTFLLFLHIVCMVVSATLLVLMICDPTHFHPKK